MAKPNHLDGVHIEGNHINGPVLGQGVQIYINGASATAPATGAEARRAAGRLMLHTWMSKLCQGTWGVCTAAPVPLLFVFATCLRFTGFSDALMKGWSAVLAPAILAFWCGDVAFFWLRRRWEARGIAWLTSSEAQPTFTQVAWRVFANAVVLCVPLFMMEGAPLWSHWL
ncbi:hypothetical protein [Streptomyces sp. G45]|uniref:hypothetical protein n=1 Tax=Streptomyces sp. G45 TaxID=3406627 RepID=UPI003C25441D